MDSISGLNAHHSLYVRLARLLVPMANQDYNKIIKTTVKGSDGLWVGPGIAKRKVLLKACKPLTGNVSNSEPILFSLLQE